MGEEKIVVNGKIFVVNFGSSSFKFQILEMPEEKLIAKGTVERIGTEGSSWKFTFFVDDQEIVVKDSSYLPDHIKALDVVLDALFEYGVIKDKSEIVAVGHRVLHGGELYKDSAVINDSVFEDIKKLKKLGPLHQPPQIKGIECMTAVFPDVPQISAFDTAFHQTIEKKYYLYAVLLEWYIKYGIRRYGFHGTNVKYCVLRVKELLDSLGIIPKNMIICHLGNGASITAVEDGKSVNTSMGFTPLDGLMMGTRCGDIDASIVQHIHDETDLTTDQIFEILNKKSGLFGITGMSDFRDVKKAAKEGNVECQLALEMFKLRILKFISEYNTQLHGKVDAIVFTGGIGENDAELRSEIIKHFSTYII